MSTHLDPITFATGNVIGDRIEGRWITMSNALTRASHGLTLSEKRLIMMAVAQLDSRSNPPDSDLVTEIRATEYAEQFDVDPSTAYRQMTAAADALYERSITFYEAAHHRKIKSKPLEPTRIKMRWVFMAKYHEGEGVIRLGWSPTLLPHLMGLRKQFTSYQLKQASALRSIYSWKLLELLMRFKTTGWAEYTVEDFAESMGATEKQRANFNNIRRKIIDPAIKELTEKDHWIIELTTTKRGRRIRRLRFDFKRNDQLSLDI
jgi:plasmid replication initiation protein